MVRSHFNFWSLDSSNSPGNKKNEIVLLLLLGEPKRHLKDSFFRVCYVVNELNKMISNVLAFMQFATDDN